MEDSNIDEILNSLKGVRRAPVPEGFENRVITSWNRESEQETILKMRPYWVAACLVGFTMVNVFSAYFTDLTESYSEDPEISLETQFAEEYKLVNTDEYYTFNEQTK